jgi:ribosome-binding factor A
MSRRTERVSGLLREEISKRLLEGLHDPRLGQVVTVTGVNVSPDLRHASVRVSVLGDAAQQRDAIAAFEAATGFLQRELAQRLQLKRAPELKIELDGSIAEGDRVLALLDSLKDADALDAKEAPEHG